MSKAHGLPGLRIGWLACREPELLDRVRELKLYTTICSSAPSELLVALALRHGERLIERNRELVLAQPAAARRLPRPPRRSCSSGSGPPPGRSASRGCPTSPTCEGWCERTAERAGVLVLPGSVYEQPHHVRFGFGRANLPLALERLDGYLG